MNRSPRTKYIDLWTRVISLAWGTIIISSFIWEWRDAHHDAVGFAVSEARAVADRDMIIHRWASRHGGVRVPIIPKGSLFVASSPTGTTPPLELLNPSELVRATHDPSLQKAGPSGKIVSLTPLVPDNKPDAWEEAALNDFESGAASREVYGICSKNGHTMLRFIQPMLVGPSCIQCHEDQGYRIGGYHGALSVSLTMTAFDRAVKKRRISTAIFHLLIGSVGMLGIVWSARRFRHHAMLQEQNEHRFRLFYENAPIAYQALDAHGQILEVNGAWLQLFGYVRSEVVGCPLASLVEPTQVEALRSWLATCRDSGQIGFVQLRLRTKIGVYVDISLQSCAWQGIDSESSEIHGVVRTCPATGTGNSADAPVNQT